MAIVVSLLMIAVGAIMRFAVTVEGNGFNVGTVGMILMIVGAIGAVLSIAFCELGWLRAPFHRHHLPEHRGARARSPLALALAAPGSTKPRPASRTDALFRRAVVLVGDYHQLLEIHLVARSLASGARCAQPPPDRPQIER